MIITKSNQALNHIFEKISRSDINKRHLLRLGHGELIGEFTKSGRINSFLELRLELLQKVVFLAQSLGYPGIFKVT